MAVVSRKRGPVRPDARNVLRGQATRRTILGAARRRILAEGFEDVRLDDIAREAGVSKAAVIKSIGGKSALLLALAEEDRQTRIDVIEDARRLRSGLERRLAHVVRHLLRLDAERLNLVMAFAGYMWFWRGDDRVRAQSMVDDTRLHMCELIAEASAAPLARERLDCVSRRLVAGYAIGLRDLHYGRQTFEQAVRFAVRFALE